MQRSLSCSQLAVSARHNTTPPPLQRSSTSPTTGNRSKAASDISPFVKRFHNDKSAIIRQKEQAEAEADIMRFPNALYTQMSRHQILRELVNPRNPSQRDPLRIIQQAVEECYHR